MLYDTLGVHQKGKTPNPAPSPNAMQTRNKIVAFVDDCSTNVKVITKKQTPTNGPDGTISNKTFTSTHMVLEGLTRLQRSIQAINPSFIQLVCLQVCMTSVLENLHAVTKRKHPTPTVLEHARSVGHAMHESIKEMSLWSVKYLYPAHFLLPCARCRNEVC